MLVTVLDGGIQVRHVVQRHDDGSMLVHYRTVVGIPLPAVRMDSVDANGFLPVMGRIMRDGWLEYGDQDGTWGEFRPADEVDRSLDSFRLLPLTLGHPSEFLNPDNVDRLAIGSLGSRVERDPSMPDHIQTDVMITARRGLDAVRDGVIELSVGFSALVLPRNGVDSITGKPYRFIQTNIVGNHTALLPRGRAGPDARLFAGDQSMTTPRKDILDPGSMATIKIGETEFQVPAPVAEAFSRLLAAAPAPAAPVPAAPVAAPAAPAAPVAAPAAPVEPVPNTSSAHTPAAGTPAASSSEDPDKDKDEEDKDKKDAATLLAKLDTQDIVIKGLQADAAKRDRIDLLERIAVTGFVIDPAKHKTDAEIMRAVIANQMPELVAKLDEHANVPGYLLRSFDQVIDFATKGAAKGNAILRAVNDSAASLSQITDNDPLLNEIEKGSN